MSDVNKRVSPGRARLVGLFWINIPVFILMMGGWCIPALAAIGHLETATIGVLGAVILFAAWIVLPFVAAWTWWSFNVPRWRICALEHCDDWEAVEAGAISDGLIWDTSTRLEKFFPAPKSGQRTYARAKGSCAVGG